MIMPLALSNGSRKRCILRISGWTYGNPDFSRFAESFGATGLKVKEGDDLAEVLEKAFSLNKVTVIECPIDYSVNYETFSIELGNFTCKF